jgi:MFS family permease
MLLCWLLYAFVLASGIMQVSVVPLLPAYTHRYGLSGLDEGMLLAATGLATLVVSLPAGAWSDRFGAKTMTLCAGILMAVAALTEALAPSFTILLLSRLVFGIGYGITWTAGLSWLASAVPGGSSLGGSVATAGLAGIVGPGLFGVLAEYLGLAVPFLLACALLVSLSCLLWFVRLPAPQSAPFSPIGPSLRVLAADRSTILAAMGIAVAGVAGGLSNLLVPGVLHAAHHSSGAIGIVFSVAGLLFLAGSSATAAFGQRAVRFAVAGAAIVALALAISPAALSAGPVAVLAMLWASTAARSVIWTVSYPLGALGAEQSGVGLGVVMGLLNVVWAVVAVLTPLAAGAMVETVGTRTIFGLSVVVCLAGLAVATFASWWKRPAAVAPEISL